MESISPTEHTSAVGPQNTPLTSLPTEILVNIVKYVDLKDAYNLLTTCKLIHGIAYERLWSTLGFVSSAMRYDKMRIKNDFQDGYGYNEDVFEDSMQTEIFKSRLGWYLLRKLQRSADEGELRFGWHHIKHLTFNSAGIFGFEPLMTCLRDKIENNEMKLLTIYVDLNSAVDSRSSINKFLSKPKYAPVVGFFAALKRYAKSNPGKLSIEIRAPPEICPALELFDTQSIVSLCFMIPNGGKGAEAIGASITKLASSLYALSNLRDLSASAELCSDPWQMQELSAQLTGLQKAFDSLKKLRRLEFIDCLFHPSFFLNPPEGVKILAYMDWHVTSVWWQALSRAALPNVEWLHVDAYRSYEWRDRELEEALGITSESNELGLFAATNLKEFYTGHLPNGPTNFIDCVLASNSGIIQECKDRFLDRKIKPIFRRYNGILIDRIEKYQAEELPRLRQKWRDGLQGEEFGDTYLRECLQALTKKFDDGC